MPPFNIDDNGDVEAVPNLTPSCPSPSLSQPSLSQLLPQQQQQLTHLLPPQLVLPPPTKPLRARSLDRYSLHVDVSQVFWFWSIIRDYGQRRLREVEAHRQKVKPLKVRGNQEVTSASGNSNSSGPGSGGGGGGGSAGSQTVPNRLLATLRSLNPAVRRQSSQANHYPGSPPASAGSGGPAAVATSLGGATTGNSSPGISCGTPAPPSQCQQQQHQHQQQQQQCLQPGSASQRFVQSSVAHGGGLFELPLEQQQPQQPQQQQLPQHQQHPGVQSSGSEDLTSLGGTGSDSVAAAECLEATLAHLQHKQRRHNQQQQNQHALEQQEKRPHMFTEDFSGRRRSLAYIRTAYTKFRNVFHRRRQQGQRRSLDSALYYGVSGKGEGGWAWGGAKRGVSRGMVVGTQSLEAVEGRLYGDSMNTETCSLGSQTARGKWLIGGDDDEGDEGDRLIEGYRRATSDQSDSEEEKCESHIRQTSLDREELTGNETKQCLVREKAQQSCNFDAVFEHDQTPNPHKVSRSDKIKAKLSANDAAHRKSVSKDRLKYMPLCSENLDERFTKNDNERSDSYGLANVSSLKSQTSTNLAQTEVSGTKHVAFEEQNKTEFNQGREKPRAIHRSNRDGQNSTFAKDQRASCETKLPNIEKNTSVDHNRNKQNKVELYSNNPIAFGNLRQRSLSPSTERRIQNVSTTDEGVNMSDNCRQNQSNKYPNLHPHHNFWSCSGEASLERNSIDSMRGDSLETLQGPDTSLNQNYGFSVNFSPLTERSTKFGVASRPGNIAQSLLQCASYRPGSLTSLSDRGPAFSHSGSLDQSYNSVDVSAHKTVGFQASCGRNVNPTSVHNTPVTSSSGLLSSLQVLPPSEQSSFISPFASSLEKPHLKKSMPCVSFLSFSRQTSGNDSLSPCLPPADGSSSPNPDDTPTTAGTLSQSWSNDTLHSSHELAVLEEIRPRSRTSEFKPSRIRAGLRDRASVLKRVSPQPASPTAFDLMCRCNPAENFNKYIGNRRIGGRLAQLGPSSLSYCNKSHDETAKNLGSIADGGVWYGNNNNSSTTTTDNNNSNASALPGVSISDDATTVKARREPSRDFYNFVVFVLSKPRTRKSSASPTLSRRSLSYPNLQDIRDWNSEPKARRSSSQEERHFTFDDTSGPNVSPTISRLRKQKADGIQREGSGKCGRSQPMSIIQASSSDYPYHQIAEQLQTMSGMIDKRLTQLEEVYHLTTERLDKLTSLQESLMRILSQNSPSQSHQLDRGDTIGSDGVSGNASGNNSVNDSSNNSSGNGSNNASGNDNSDVQRGVSLDQLEHEDTLTASRV
ncbi:hypothetical protein ElyMa_002488200 [Elysia marginata]|uniref:Uncharacterized protein n=1 Tax=Elysia marginata TaxID=1093978 RepID=A0AAV4GQN8_9GAST|nr:hypothetical protein ElyMa_002488200 [Elysia marginata]